MSALFAELVGLKKEGKTWKEFPHNLTFGGIVFLLLTIIFCFLSMLSISIDEESAAEEQKKLHQTIKKQDGVIHSLKSDVNDLKSTLKNYQHPIPDKFNMWLDMRFALSNSESKKQLDKFDLFNSLFVAFLFHTPNTNNNVKMEKEIPNIFGIQSNGITKEELEKNNSIIIQMYGETLQVVIKDLEFVVAENNTDYTSIHDLCKKYGELRVELYNEEGYYSKEFKISKLSLFTPERYQLEVEDIKVEGTVAEVNTIKNCWK